jgi:hypothetical protein
MGLAGASRSALAEKRAFGCTVAAPARKMPGPGSAGRPRTLSDARFFRLDRRLLDDLHLQDRRRRGVAAPLYRFVPVKRREREPLLAIFKLHDLCLKRLDAGRPLARGAEPCAMRSTLATSAATSSSGRNRASSDLDQWPESRGNRVANLWRLVGFVGRDHFRLLKFWPFQLKPERPPALDHASGAERLKSIGALFTRSICAFVSSPQRATTGAFNAGGLLMSDAPRIARRRADAAVWLNIGAPGLVSRLDNDN